jgi:hypothetical protein
MDKDKDEGKSLVTANGDCGELELIFSEETSSCEDSLRWSSTPESAAEQDNFILRVSLKFF